MGVYVCTCMCSRVLFHLPIYLFFFTPNAFSNRQKLTWDLKAQDGYHDAIFYNDNLGKKKKKANIISNQLSALNKKQRKKDVTEKRLHLTWSNILSQFSLNYL